MHLKTPSAKWRPFCLGLNVLITSDIDYDGWRGPGMTAYDIDYDE